MTGIGRIIKMREKIYAFWCSQMEIYSEMVTTVKGRESMFWQEEIYT